MTARCNRCGEAHASFGIGPPLVEKHETYCGICVLFQPSTQRRVAEAARNALDDKT